MTDDDLWQRVIKTVKTLDRSDLGIDQGEKPPNPKIKPGVETLSTNNKKLVAPRHLNIDRNTWGQIDKGRLHIDHKIDLHGMTVNQAYKAFQHFIRDCIRKEYKCVIVVTGKGSKEKGTGKIRREFPHWIEAKEIAPFIHAFSEPSRNRGRYVLILRKAHKIS